VQPSRPPDFAHAYERILEMERLINDQSCMRCPVLVGSRHRIVHGYGDPAAGIVLIGEAPGRHGADRTGIPFTGDRSGRRLGDMLTALELAVPTADGLLLRCFVTNVVRCCPPLNRTPTPYEQQQCTSFLAAELDAIAPWLIVPIGRLALRAVGLRYLGSAFDQIRPLHATVLQARSCRIVPLIHPARISHAQISAFLTTMRAQLHRPH